MKKSISILSVAILIISMFVACGPSKAELEAKEVAKTDSIKADSAKKAAEMAAEIAPPTDSVKTEAAPAAEVKKEEGKK